MLLRSVSSLLGALLVWQAAPPAPKHTWIADLKANRATLGTAEVRVQGDVVDIRSTSPTAKFGFYRLIDASDPAGLLVRTNQLPKEGGALLLRGRVAAQQPPDGSLLLDEIERERADQQSNVALVFALISALCLVTMSGLLIRAAVEERRYKVSPPLWLLPDAGPYGKGVVAPGTPGPPLKYSPELEDADRKQRERLQVRRRNLFQLTLGSLALFGVSGAWLLISRPASAQMPAFIFIEADDIPVPAVPTPPPLADTSLAVHQPAVDSTLITLPPQRRKDPSTPPSSPAPAPRSRVTDTVATPPATPAPAPLPPPPPPPTPPPAPEPPPLDPEVERTRAAEVLADAAQSLVAAINAHRILEVAQLLPEGMAGDLGRRERFMKLVREFAPRGTLGSVEATTLAQTGAEARFAVAFTWRGDFGVDRRKTGHFLGIVRREESGWRFQGARLLDAVP